MSAQPSRQVTGVTRDASGAVVVTFATGDRETFATLAQQEQRAAAARARDTFDQGARRNWLTMSKGELDAYVDSIVPRNGATAPTTPPADDVPDPTCPKCGAPMVSRVAHKGARAGRPFYGCSTFPRCRGTRDVDGRQGADEEAPTPTPTPTPTSEAPTPTSGAPDGADELAAAIRRIAATATPPAPTVDEETVRRIVADSLRDFSVPTTIRVKQGESPARDIPGIHHYMTPEVLETLDAGDHVMMVGPAGTGKSTIAHTCATALGYEFGAISLAPTTPLSALFGYMDAAGNYVTTEFRKRYEHGGVFLFDEIDNGHPSILAALNMALANGSCAFPDGMVDRHETFLAVGAANTYGTGPDRRYVGRQALDAATLDRFSFIEVPVDEALETTVALAQGADPIATNALIRFVRALRANTDRHGLPLVFSPRASIMGARLLAKGIPMPRVIAMRVRRGISDTDWAKVSQGVEVPA